MTQTASHPVEKKQSYPAPTHSAPPRKNSAQRFRGKMVKETPALVLLAILIVLVVMPMALVFIAALTTAVPRPGNAGLGAFTWDNFKILATPEAAKGLGNSLLIGLGSSAIALVIGSLLAFICARTDAPLRKFIFIIGMAPVFVPALVGALAWSLLASPTAGFANLLLRDLGMNLTINIYSLGGLIFCPRSVLCPVCFHAGPQLTVHDECGLGGSGNRTWGLTAAYVPHSHPAADAARPARFGHPGIRSDHGKLSSRRGPRQPCGHRNPADLHLPADELHPSTGQPGRRHRHAAHGGPCGCDGGAAVDRQPTHIHDDDRQGCPSTTDPVARLALAGRHLRTVLLRTGGGVADGRAVTVRNAGVSVPGLDEPALRDRGSHPGTAGQGGLRCRLPVGANKLSDRRRSRGPRRHHNQLC